jgi:Protein of unknown function (DUF2878)
VIQNGGATYQSKEGNQGQTVAATVFTSVSRHVTWVALLNGMMFNLTWFVIVSTHSSALAPVIVACHLLLHFLMIGKGAVELILVVLVTLIGAVIDPLLFHFGVLVDPQGVGQAPLWLMCIWPVLGTTLLHAFAGLQQRLLLAAVLGGASGAASYSAGMVLSPISFGDAGAGPVVLGMLWFVMFPLLLALAKLIHTLGER